MTVTGWMPSEECVGRAGPCGPHSPGLQSHPCPSSEDLKQVISPSELTSSSGNGYNPGSCVWVKCAEVGREMLREGLARSDE